MPNRLAQEISPYLLQHADNPVDWHPWGEAGLTLSRTQEKPILLSIGYSACHLLALLHYPPLGPGGTLVHLLLGLSGALFVRWWALRPVR